MGHMLIQSRADEPGVLIYLLLIASISGEVVYAALSLHHVIVLADSNRDGQDLLKSSGSFIAGADSVAFLGSS